MTAGAGGEMIRGFLQTLARHRALAIMPLLGVPAVALILSFGREPVFEAEARLISSSTASSHELVGAFSPAVAQRVLAELPGSGLDAQELREDLEVVVDREANLLVFRFRSSDEVLARRAVNLYAREYVRLRRQLDAVPLASLIRPSIGLVRTRPGAISPQLLEERRSQLRLLRGLEDSSVPAVDPAVKIVQEEPRLASNLLVGLLIGGFLGIGSAFLAQAVDVRIRGREALSGLLGQPILAEFSPGPERDGDPGATPPALKGLVALRDNIEHLLGRRDAGVVVTAGARWGDGSAAVAFDLAVALALSGRRVALVDLDPLSPALTRFFGLTTQLGAADCLRGTASLDSALTALELEEAGAALHILPAGVTAPDERPGFEEQGTARLLDELGRRMDLVIADIPPLLEPDAPIPQGPVGARLVVVADPRRLQESAALRLRRVIERCPFEPLGVVIAGRGGAAVQPAKAAPLGEPRWGPA